MEILVTELRYFCVVACVEVSSIRLISCDLRSCVAVSRSASKALLVALIYTSVSLRMLSAICKSLLTFILATCALSELNSSIVAELSEEFIFLSL